MHKKNKLCLIALVASMLFVGCGDAGNNTESENVSGEFSVAPVEGLSDDFLFGCDVSTLIAQENLQLNTI